MICYSWPSTSLTSLQNCGLKNKAKAFQRLLNRPFCTVCHSVPVDQLVDILSTRLQPFWPQLQSFVGANVVGSPVEGVNPQETTRSSLSTTFDRRHKRLHWQLGVESSVDSRVKQSTSRFFFTAGEESKVAKEARPRRESRRFLWRASLPLVILSIDISRHSGRDSFGGILSRTSPPILRRVLLHHFSSRRHSTSSPFSFRIGHSIKHNSPITTNL